MTAWKYINISENSSFLKRLAAYTNLPVTSYYLNIGEIKNMLNHRF